MNDATVVGDAPNVDMRKREPPAILSPPEADRPRLVEVSCNKCGAEDTLMMEPGRTRRWEHDLKHPSHLVSYYEVSR